MHGLGSNIKESRYLGELGVLLAISLDKVDSTIKIHNIYDKNIQNMSPKILYF